MAVGENSYMLIPAKPKRTVPKEFKTVAKKMAKQKSTKGKGMKAYKQGYRGS